MKAQDAAQFTSGGLFGLSYTETTLLAVAVVIVVVVGLILLAGRRK